MICSGSQIVVVPARAGSHIHAAAAGFFTVTDTSFLEGMFYEYENEGGCYICSWR